MSISHAARLMSKIRFSSRRKLPLIYQTEASECGLACLAMVANYYGWQTDIIELRKSYPVSLNGSNLKGLLHTAGKMQLQGRPVRAKLSALEKLNAPCILHWEMNHFVVLKRVRGNKVTIHDPAQGELTLTLDQVSPYFTGVAIELYPTEHFRQKEAPKKMKLTDLWSSTTGLKKSIFYTLILSVVIQIIALASPFYMQIVIDEVVPKYDTDLLFVVAAGFTLLMLINVVTSFMRSMLMLYLGNSLSIQMTRNLFHHLMYLPMQWFEKRHMGDILSRFGSTSPVGNLFSEGIAAAIIDGVMAITTGIIMWLYAPQLALVVMIAIIVFSIVRFALFRLIKARNKQAIVAGAKENTTFIESVSAIQTIKIFGRENEREATWLNSLINKVNSRISAARILVFFGSFQGVLFGIENVLVVYLGAKLIFENNLSIGMLFAFMAYKQQFSGNIQALIERIFDFKMLSLHLERLADIAFERPEADLDSVLIDREATPQQQGNTRTLPEFLGKIEFKDVWFKYGDADPWILKGLSFIAEAGEMLVFTGPSGGGKTTLLKLVLGLAKPTKGQILIDNKPLESLDMRHYRQAFGSVMQQDSLMSGSIADNITFFDQDVDPEQMELAARNASIIKDIETLPMKYDTLIGHMGSSLSGGQQQRLLLARALYRNPTFLVMDEGTANLDAENEKAILKHIKSLPVTRITVAHKEAVIQSADRLIQIENGVLIEPKSQVRQTNISEELALTAG
ncbi:peptidase domain-containing ABC transporter [Agaribacter marinus]|uniref:ABC transporter n=1 Tax=Agaribacter marinus TaxID=1431249 RepID=A0AA37WJ27_9ALTE|nr:peptidase domain-containing ABC transporter [Agaribacter marinus]GLR72571.1 ABC transporter [Agaribacter marinus]